MNDVNHNGLSVVLPAQLASVFTALRKGRHLCRLDGDGFFDLERNTDAYERLFAGLGYQLVRHPREFFFLQGKQRSFVPGDRTHAIALFILVLFQHLEDTKFQEEARAWERHLLERSFEISNLPHFTTSGPRKDWMDRAGISRENLRQKVLRVLDQWGIIEFEGPERFRFRPGIYRFVDLCEAFAKEAVWPPDAKAIASDENSSQAGVPATESGDVDGEDDEP